MTITLHQDEATPTTLRANFCGVWTWEEFYSAFDRVNAMIDSREQTIDIVADLTQSPALPPGIFWHLSHLADHLVDNAGLIVVVTVHRVHLAVYISACGLFPKMTRFLRVTETHDMAQIMIEAQHNLKTED